MTRKNGALIPASKVIRQVAKRQTVSQRAVLTDAIKACIKIVRAQDKQHKQAFVYAKAMCDNERELGKQLQTREKTGGPGRGKKTSENQTSFLSQIGISRDRSHRAQRMAKVPSGQYEDWLEMCQIEDEQGRITLPTLTGLFGLYEGNPPIGRNTGKVEWYTPKKYIDSARATMGGIDLDPASSSAANRIVRAKKFYSESADGLTKVWAGRVWLNPPFSNLLGFAEKLIEQAEGNNVPQAVFLGPNYSDSCWWQQLARVASSICHTNHRIRFVSKGTEKATKESPTNGHTFFYLGDKTDAFHEEFQQWGVIR